MSWIALKMLVGDRAKFVGIVMGLTFAALLITQQGSIFCGLMSRTAGQVYDIRGADLWVMDPNVRYIDDVKPMIENNLQRVRGVEGVEWAVPLYKGNARVKVNSLKTDATEHTTYEEVAPPSERVAAPGKLTLEVLIAKADAGPRSFVWAGDDEQGPLLTDQPGEPNGRRYRFLSGDLGVGGLAGPDHHRIAPVEGGPAITVRPGREEVIEQVILLGLDDASMVGAPAILLAGELKDLRRPDAVIIDYTRLRKLFPGEPWDAHTVDSTPISSTKFLLFNDAWHTLMVALGRRSPGAPPWKAELREKNRVFYERFLGRELEMNDKRAVIVGICEATRTFQSNAIVYTTFSRTKLFVPRERKMLSYVLAKADKDHDPGQVAAAIRATTGLKSRTSVEFIRDTIRYYMYYTGIPINFGITAALGFLVGTAIAGQTFYNFTLDNIKQFGALKAMGATNGRIVSMILLQAVVVGLLGYGIGVGLASLFGEVSKGGELAYYTPLELLPLTGVAVVLICVLSTVLSVRRVIVLEPAVVFRG